MKTRQMDGPTIRQEPEDSEARRQAPTQDARHLRGEYSASDYNEARRVRAAAKFHDAVCLIGPMFWLALGATGGIVVGVFVGAIFTIAPRHWRR